MANSSHHKKLAAGCVRQIVLIGCGGTGSFLAEHLCRMIAGFRLDCELVLADGDTVETANVWRQNFSPHEIGQNKAQALALRLAGRFGFGIEVIDGYVEKSNVHSVSSSMRTLLMTATDSLASRKTIASINSGFWLDVGNEKTFGQAVLGTTHKSSELCKVYWNWEKKKGYVSDLPDIAAMNPAILTARKARKRTGCGQMPFAEQGFGINAMAALAAAVLAKQVVVDGVVTTAAVYFDTDTGRMTPRLIDKELFSPWMRKEKNT